MRMRGPLNGSTGVARARRHPLALPAPRPASHTHRRVANADAFIERIAAGLMLLAVIATFTLSSSVLTNWKIHYVTAGGNFYEKLHPATYFTLLAFFLLLIRSRGPIGELNRMFSESKLLLAYLLCWLFLLIQVFVLERPFTVIIDTGSRTTGDALARASLSPSDAAVRNAISDESTEWYLPS